MVDKIPEAKWDLRLTVLMTILNIIGGIAFWLSLPQKLTQAKETLVDHETRIRALELDRGLLQRIDERTSSIQNEVRQMHSDFSFRASGRPTE